MDDGWFTHDKIIVNNQAIKTKIMIQIQSYLRVLNIVFVLSNAANYFIIIIISLFYSFNFAST